MISPLRVSAVVGAAALMLPASVAHAGGSTAASTTTPVPPAGVVVTTSQDPVSCRITVTIGNERDRTLMLSWTDERGNQPPAGIAPGRAFSWQPGGVYWSVRLDEVGGVQPLAHLGAKTFERPCIGDAPVPRPDVPEVQTSSTSIVRAVEPRIVARVWAPPVRGAW